MLLQMTRFPLLMANIPIYIYIYNVIYGISSLSILLRMSTMSFHTLAILNNVTLNLRAHTSFQLFSFSFCKYPEVEFLDHIVVLFLIF